MSDLLERLRRVEGGGLTQETQYYRNPDGPEAADEIDRLRERITDLEAALHYTDLARLKATREQ